MNGSDDDARRPVRSKRRSLVLQPLYVPKSKPLMGPPPLPQRQQQQQATGQPPEQQQRENVPVGQVNSESTRAHHAPAETAGVGPVFRPSGGSGRGDGGGNTGDDHLKGGAPSSSRALATMETAGAVGLGPLSTPLPGPGPAVSGEADRSWPSDSSQRRPDTSLLLKLFDRLGTPQTQRSRGAMQTPAWERLRGPDSQLEEALASAHKALDLWDQHRPASEGENGDQDGDGEGGGGGGGDRGKVAGASNDGAAATDTAATGGEAGDGVGATPDGGDRSTTLATGAGGADQVMTRRRPSGGTLQLQRDDVGPAMVARARHTARMRALREEEQALARALSGLKRTVQKGLRRREVLDIQQTLLVDTFGPLLPSKAPPVRRSDAARSSDTDAAAMSGSPTEGAVATPAASRPPTASSSSSAAAAVAKAKAKAAAARKSWRTTARRRVLEGVRRMAAVGKEVDQAEVTVHKLRRWRERATRRFQQLVAVRCAMQVVLEEQDEILHDRRHHKEEARAAEQRASPPRGQRPTDPPPAVAACLASIAELRGGGGGGMDAAAAAASSSSPSRAPPAPLDMAGDTTAVDLLRFLAQGPVVHAFTASSGAAAAHERALSARAAALQQTAVIRAGTGAQCTQQQQRLQQVLVPAAAAAGPGASTEPVDFDNFPSDEDTTASEADEGDDGFAGQDAAAAAAAAAADFDAYDNASSTDEDEADGAAAEWEGRTMGRRMLSVTDGLRAALDIVAP